MFAELSTSSESEVEADDSDDDDVPVEKVMEEEILESKVEFTEELEEPKSEDKFDHDWLNVERKLSESSDRPLVIDEKKDSDEGRYSEEEYQRAYEMDDLYRDDTSESDSEKDEPNEERIPSGFLNFFLDF